MNTDLITNYPDIFDSLKMQPWNSVEGVAVRHPARSWRQPADVRTDEVTPAPDSWSAVFDEAEKHKGKVTAYDSPIYIADAALYLMATKPELGIKNPYALDAKQLDCGCRPAQGAEGQRRRVLVGLPQGDPGLQERLVDGRHHVAGDREPRPGREGPRRRWCCPRKARPAGRTRGWSARSRKHKTCAYKFIDHIVSPKTNAADRRVLR